jgi:hypothetical protein
MSAAFECILVVQQNEYLSLFLFALFINDMKHKLRNHGVDGTCLGDLKLFMLLYVDDAELLHLCIISCELTRTMS